MDQLNIVLGDDATFDRIVHRGIGDAAAIAQASIVTIATKDKVTISGRAGAVIGFHVQMPDGSLRTAQATVSVRHLTTVLAALRGRYGEDGFTPDVPQH